ncbi:MAG: hypothetical protein ACK4VV_13295 [Pseudomonas sp.]
MITEAQFNRCTLECMTTLRRRLKQELGVTVRLNEEDAVAHLIELSRGSQHGDIRELGLRLGDLTSSEVPAETPAPEVQFGVGAIASRHRLLHQIPDPGYEQTPEPSHSASPAVRIYRGQIVR